MKQKTHKTRCVLAGMAAFLLVFGLVLAGCPTDTPPDDDGGSGKPATPTATPAAGVVTFGTEITLATTTEGADIYYTTDGSEPGPNSSSTEYSDSDKPKITASPVTLKAVAFDPEKPVYEKDAHSDVLTVVYTVSGGGGPRIWTAVAATTFGADDHINAIAWGGGKFVATGEEGRTSNGAYSADGKTWTEITGLGTAPIAWGGGIFTSGYNYSTDGETWTRVTPPTPWD